MHIFSIFKRGKNGSYIYTCLVLEVTQRGYLQLRRKPNQRSYSIGKYYIAVIRFIVYIST